MSTQCSHAEAALARRDNARRLMRAALELFDEGHREAAEVMRWLSRLEYARAVAAVLPGGELAA